MTNQLFLKTQHEKAGAKFVNFANYEMPINYGSQIQEHTAVRENCGVFDVSHMNVIDVTGPDSKEFLRYLLANDIEKIKTPGKALYSCLLNHNAGILDDLVVYHLNANYYRVILNAARKTEDLEWIYNELKNSNFNCHILERNELVMLAVQGPKSLDIFKNPEIKNIFKDLENMSIFSSEMFSRKICSALETTNLNLTEKQIDLILANSFNSYGTIFKDYFTGDYAEKSIQKCGIDNFFKP